MGTPETEASEASFTVTDTTAQPPAEPQQPVYPDHYTHAHPTDSEGRPLPPPASETKGKDSVQQDWVGGVATTDKPAEGAAAAGYAPSHERGT